MSTPNWGGPVHWEVHPDGGYCGNGLSLGRREGDGYTMLWCPCASETYHKPGHWYYWTDVPTGKGRHWVPLAGGAS